MFFSAPILAPIVLKNASLVHIEKNSSDEVFKDVCQRLIHGM